jgi:hypothetical protein
MLKIRTILSFVVLVLMLMNTYQLVAAGTEIISNPSNDPTIVDSSPGGSINQIAVPNPPFPSPTFKCVSMPEVLGSIAACPNASQIPVIVNSDPGGTTNQIKIPGPSFHSTQVKCIDMPGVLGSVVACPNASQIPAPEWWTGAHSAANY